jgi:3,4-dihydroxy 2-butanone 4-phosphate synthase/GTP cyclohydrolase II
LLTKVRRMRHLLNLDPGFDAATDPQQSLLALSTARATGHRQRTGRPFITLTYAQSLDGCIAAWRSQPLSLSGPQALTLTHRLRSAHDAILVGIGTVLADNPRLNVRLVEGKDPQPVVADSRLRFPLQANLLQQHPLSPWIATSERADQGRQRRLEAAGARVLRLPTTANGRVDLTALLERLAEWGVNSLMVEGGARIITSFLAEQLVDQLVLTVVPRLVGGLHAVGKLRQLHPARLPSLRNSGYQRLGEDLVLWGEVAWGQD